MVVFTQFTDSHLYYRQYYWLKHRKRIKKKFLAQRLRRTTKKDYSHSYILIIILNLAIYKLYFDITDNEGSVNLLTDFLTLIFLDLVY